MLRVADWAVGTSSEAGLGLGACLALCQENVVADEQGEHGEQERTRSTPSPHPYAPPTPHPLSVTQPST